MNTTEALIHATENTIALSRIFMAHDPCPVRRAGYEKIIAEGEKEIAHLRQHGYISLALSFQS